MKIIRAWGVTEVVLWEVWGSIRAQHTYKSTNLSVQLTPKAISMSPSAGMMRWSMQINWIYKRVPMLEGKPAGVQVSMTYSVQRHSSITQSKGKRISSNNKGTRQEPESQNSSSSDQIPILPGLIVNRESCQGFSSNRRRKPMRRRARCQRASEASMSMRKKVEVKERREWARCRRSQPSVWEVGRNRLDLMGTRILKSDKIRETPARKVSRAWKICEEAPRS